MKVRYITLLVAIILASSAGFSLAALPAPLSLDRDLCRAKTLAYDRTVAKARNSIRQAELDRKVADASRLPGIDGSLMGLYMLPDIDMMGSKLSVRGAYMAGLQLVQPIYAGGKITAGRKLAGIGVKAADAQLRLAESDVLMAADNAYWTYIAVCDKVKLMDSFKAMIDTLYMQTYEAVEVGMAVGNDLLRIEAKRSEIEYQIKKVANGRELCRLNLCNMMGVDLDTPILALDTVPEAMEPVSLAGDVTARPEYQLLQLQHDAAREQIKMVRGDYLPTVGLSLGYTYYGNMKMKGMVEAAPGNYVPFTQNMHDGIGMGILAVDIPLFHWGEGVRKVRKAKIEAENARLDLEHNASLMNLELQQAVANVRDGWNMIIAARKAMEQASENLRVMNDRYSESMATLTDLLDAQTQWQQSRSNLIEAQTQYQIYLSAYEKAAGRL